MSQDVGGGVSAGLWGLQNTQDASLLGYLSVSLTLPLSLCAFTFISSSHCLPAHSPALSHSACLLLSTCLSLSRPCPHPTPPLPVSPTPVLGPVLDKGQVMTGYYRWLRRAGGFVWLQSVATVAGSGKSPGEHHVLWVSHVLR